jgi:hypothetical protein
LSPKSDASSSSANDNPTTHLSRYSPISLSYWLVPLFL